MTQFLPTTNKLEKAVILFDADSPVDQEVELLVDLGKNRTLVTVKITCTEDGLTVGIHRAGEGDQEPLASTYIVEGGE